MTKTTIGSWGEISLQELAYAYRKAKADCFFERSLSIAEAFVEYEADLPSRLETILDRLWVGDVSSLLQENLGKPQLVAKKLGTEPKPGATGNGHGFFSDPGRAFERLCETHDLVPEFRLVGDFPVEMHVLSALWINLVGHRFDAALSNSTYGSRLRRYRPEPGSPTGSLGGYHAEAVGSFQAYFGPYKRWRGDGLKAIRQELQAERAVIAISMDLTSYYHQIDPAFIADASFHEAAGITLTEWETEFTKVFAEALSSWSSMAAKELKKWDCHKKKDKARAKIGGLPIGLSISRVISNVLLLEFDRDVERGLAPVYYGRYVDDVFLVLRDPGNVTSTFQLFNYISERTFCFPKLENEKASEAIVLSLPGTYKGNTFLSLQKTKQKAFFLHGDGGLDLLKNIESQIRSVSSERRLMPSPEHLESMASAKVLTAAGNPSEEADTLRRADGLSVRRLGWAIQLRAVETLARDLRQNDWKDERKQFYQFAHSHILRADKILDHIDYLPRLLSLAVALHDWADAVRLVDASLKAVEVLGEATKAGSIRVNGLAARNSEDVWLKMSDRLLCLARDTILRSMRWSQKGSMRPLSETALVLCAKVGLGKEQKWIEDESLRFREADLAKVPYKDHVRRDANRERPHVVGEEALADTYERGVDLKEFLQLSVAKKDEWSVARVNPRCIAKADAGIAASMLPYLFPTRPYSTREISLFLPQQCVFLDAVKKPSKDWARYVRAARGVWVWGSPEEASKEDQLADVDEVVGHSTDMVAFLGNGRPGERVRLAISSLRTEEDSWAASAMGRSDLSRGRYARIKRIVDQAIDSYPRPTHLLLPELSLPDRWIGTVSGWLRDAGISLIAGLDYEKGRNPNEIHSSAVMVLADDRLGFPAAVEIRQPKSAPAVGEDEDLHRRFGKGWSAEVRNAKKPVYVHQGFCFGVLVCSELQSMGNRHRFQGNVDCLMVLAWNKDLETFSALVEAAALDVHSYIALVNNRKFGDSRVRSPAKAHYGRDLCRLRGGENEYVVVVELDVERLRAFQSRSKPWPAPGDPFKPVPEGFRLWRRRRMAPK